MDDWVIAETDCAACDGEGVWWGLGPCPMCEGTGSFIEEGPDS